MQRGWRLASAGVAALLIVAGAGATWASQYFVDYEMSLLPFLLGKGWTLYADAIDQHTPLLPYALTLARMGDPATLQVVLVGLHALTSVLAYLLALRVAGPAWGLAALVFFEVWSFSFESTHLWYDAAVAPLYLAMLLVAAGRERLESYRWAFLVGVLVSVATPIKQHGLLALPIVILMWAGTKESSRRRIGALLTGFAGPLLVVAGFFAAQGTLDDAIYWTIIFSLEGGYWREAGLGPTGGEWLILFGLYLPIAVGVAALAKERASERRRLWVGLVGLLLVATLPAVPRYARFHLAAAIPLLAVICAVALPTLWDKAGGPERSVRKSLSLSLLVVGLSLAVGASQWIESVRFAAAVRPVSAPFEGTVGPMRAWVDANAPAGAPILVYKLDPLLYRALEREPPRPFVPPYRWFESLPNVQAQMRRGVEAARPRVAIVSVGLWDAPHPWDRGLGEYLQREYVESARFDLEIYRGAAPVSTVGLLRKGEDER